MQLQRSRPLPGRCRRRRAGARRGGARPACSTAQENQRPVNTGNAARMPEFRENLVRGRGRFCRAVIKAQASRWGSRDGGGGSALGLTINITSQSLSHLRVDSLLSMVHRTFQIVIAMPASAPGRGGAKVGPGGRVGGGGWALVQ